MILKGIIYMVRLFDTQLETILSKFATKWRIKSLYTSFCHKFEKKWLQIGCQKDVQWQNTKIPVIKYQSVIDLKEYATVSRILFWTKWHQNHFHWDYQSISNKFFVSPENFEICYISLFVSPPTMYFIFINT